MGRELLASKVITVEREPRVRSIQSAAVSIAGMVGVAERGPLNQATAVLSFDEYLKKFGGYISSSDLTAAVAGFFGNGGGKLYVVRTCHHTDYTDPSTATAVRAAGNLVTPGAATPAIIDSRNSAPFVLEHNATLVFSVGGNPNQTITILGTAAYVETAGAGPFALVDEQTLTVKFDRGRVQTLVLATGDFVDIGAATVEELRVVMNRDLDDCKATIVGGKLRLNSDIKGLDSYAEVTGGTAAATLAFTSGEVHGTGNVGNVYAVDSGDAAIFTGTGLSFSFTGTGKLRLTSTATGASASLEVKAASHDGFNFLEDTISVGADSPSATAILAEGKDPGAYGNDLSVVVEDATSGTAGDFNLLVEDDGVVVESWPNLSTSPTAVRYFETIVNHATTGSNLIRLTDQELGGNPRPTNQEVTLTTGNDGLTSLGDNDFIGHYDPDGSVALQCLVAVPELTLVSAPGRATAAVQGALVTFCDDTRDGEVFAVLDPPESQSASQIITYFETTAALLEATEQAGMYWPWVKIINPSKTVYGNDETITVPPCGHVMGVMARTAAAHPGGIYDPPAGIERGQLRGVVGFETDSVLLESVRDWVYPKRINPLTTQPGFPRYIDGSRTAKSSGNFPFVAERLGVNFIKRSVKNGIQWVRHSNNTEALRRRVKRSVTAFLLTQMRNGAFRSMVPDEAFYVDVSDELNPPSEIFAGRLNLEIGLATNKPAEFVVIGITQDTRALDEELAAAGA